MIKKCEQFVVLVGEGGAGKTEVARAMHYIDERYVMIDCSTHIILRGLVRWIGQKRVEGTFDTLCERHQVDATLVAPPQRSVGKSLVLHKAKLRPLWTEYQSILRAPDPATVMDKAIRAACRLRREGKLPIIVGARGVDLHYLRRFDPSLWHIMNVQASEAVREKRLGPEGWAKACLPGSLEATLAKDIRQFSADFPSKVRCISNNSSSKWRLCRAAENGTIPFLQRTFWTN